MSRLLQPAVIGGVFIGVLSALPLLSAGNCCCCLWVGVGGAGPAYLRRQHPPAPTPRGGAATVGLLAGLIGAVVEFVISVPVFLVAGPVQARMLQQLMERLATENPDLGRIAEQAHYSP